MENEQSNILEKQIEEKAKEIFTDSYTMSVGELVSMYNDDELELQPEYQRFFRWSNSQKTRFIESLLLGIPIPPIFVYQQEGGVWSVIDGLQRLSTIFQFMEVLKVDTNTSHEVSELELQGTKFLPSLEGKRWHGEKEHSISPKLKLFFKRERIDVKIIKYTSDVESQFELFQRLNTGGSTLTSQEIRNSLIIMENKNFYNWFEDMNLNSNYQECMPITNRQKNEKEDMEYLLRFFIYRNLDIDNIKGNEDISPFLTEEMHELIKQQNQFDYTTEEKVFQNVFQLLNESLGEDSFKKYDIQKNKFTGAVSISQFEAIVPGLSKRLEISPYEPSQTERKEKLVSLIKNLQNDSLFMEKKDQHRPIQRTKELVRFSEVYFNEL